MMNHDYLSPTYYTSKYVIRILYRLGMNDHEVIML